MRAKGCCIPRAALWIYPISLMLIIVGCQEEEFYPEEHFEDLRVAKAKEQYNFGIMYAGRSEHDRAIESFKKAIEIDPNYALAYYGLGKSYQELANYNEAIQYFKKALELKPDFFGAHINLGTVYHSLGAYFDSIESYKQAILLKPDNPEAYYNLGTAYMPLMHYDEATDAFKEAVRLMHDTLEADKNVNTEFGSFGLTGAPPSFTPIVTRKDRLAMAYSNLGGAYSKLERYSEAIKSMKNAIASNLILWRLM